MAAGCCAWSALGEAHVSAAAAATAGPACSQPSLAALLGLAFRACARIAPLASPVFGSKLESLRLYLLTHSPPPFRRRNIFIDASIGARV